MPGREELVTEVNKKLEEKKMTVDLARLYEQSILELVLQRKRVILQDFGTFELRDMASRKARNPQTGEEITVPPKSKLVFRAGDKASKMHEMKGFVKAKKK